jgi:DinB family protein
MSHSAETDLRYPIGRFQRPKEIRAELLNSWIDEIEALPSELCHAVEGLNEEQLDTPYRPGGWTVRQVVHHLPDSHINSYTRYRLALTEDAPLIKSYKEAAWADLPDAKTSPIRPSIELLGCLHKRWTTLLRSMSPEQYARTFEHPENGTVRLDWATGLYAWHGRHHLAHIAALRQRENW